MKNQGPYNSLEAQLNKLARHNRQGSYRTKERYYMAMKRFCHFVLTSTICENWQISAASIWEIMCYGFVVTSSRGGKSPRFLVKMMKSYEVFKNVIESMEKDRGVPL